LNTASVLKGKVVYVPLSDLAAAINADMTWDADTQSAYLTTFDKKPKVEKPTPKPEDGVTTIYGGISFNTAVDVDDKGRMSVEKSQEFLKKFLNTVRFVKENKTYVIKGTYPEIPEGFKIGFSIHIFMNQGIKPIQYSFNNSKDAKDEFKIPASGAFTKKTNFTSKTLKNMFVIHVTAYMGKTDVSGFKYYEQSNTGSLIARHSPAKPSEDYSSFIPNSGENIKFDTLNLKKLFGW